ncbi:hypothetical protein T484DRAFT_1766385, partial [Baffinella frigidus]
AGNSFDQQAELRSLQEYATQAAAPFLAAYYTLHYVEEDKEAEIDDASALKVAVTEDLFDKFSGIHKFLVAVTEDLFDKFSGIHKFLVAVTEDLFDKFSGIHKFLIEGSLRDKARKRCRSRDHRMKILQFQYQADRDHGNGAFAVPHDAGVLLGDLMRTGVLAFSIHVAEKLGVRLVKPPGGKVNGRGMVGPSGLAGGLEVKASRLDAPLHNAKAGEEDEEEEDVLFKRVNPRYARIAAQLLRSITEGGHL